MFRFFIKIFFVLSLPLKATVWNDCNEAFEQVEIAAQTVVLPSPAEIDYKVGLGKEFREALENRPDINWNAVADNYREWSEHTTTLSGPARMLVACVLTAVTNGLGSKWFAAHGITEGTATHAALSAGIQAVTVGAGTSLAGNLGDIGKTFDELTSVDFVKSLASTMLTAGLNLGEASTLKEGAIKGAEKIAIQTTLEGKKVGDILVGNIVDAGSAQLAHTIGDAKAGGTLNQVTHKALHAGAGAVSQALTGGDPVAGAIGAAASETAAEAMDKSDATHEERQKIAQKARLIGDTVAFVAGRDVASADSAGRTAVENNYLGHSLGLQFARQEIVNDETLSDAEKRQQLAEVDDLAQQTLLAAGKGAALGLATTAAPGITSGYFATQSAARWAGTYAGGGMQAVKQEFRDHPILSTLDLATTGMLGAGFVKGMAKPGLQIMGKQPVTRVYQPTPEQSALSLQRGFTGNKGGNIKANYEIDRRIPRYDRNTEHIVNGRRYGAHAMDQMQNRGIPPSAVENTITTGQKIPAKDGRLQYYDKTNNITVISEPNGDIVTVRYGEK